MKKNIPLHLASIILLFGFSVKLISQNPLFIPDTISGTTFSLTVQKGTKMFYPGYNTNTLGYNGAFLGPTLIMKKGDNVNIFVKNNLPIEVTTVHWHGFHIPAKFDGGPHQLIKPGTTWNPFFKILNNAATYWYHAHGHGKTEIQVGKGLAGLIIIRDSAEATYNLPRHYKIDDFPLIVQTRIFDDFVQIGSATHDDTVLMVNGTINPYLATPKQVVRFRLLNGSADRTYEFGLSDNTNFYMIASDGGLLAQPYSTKRLRLSPGERAEILIDFSNYTIGQQIYLKSYAAELPKGIIGADSVGTKTIIIQEGYYQNKLNGSNFNIIRFDIIAPTNKPITTVPSTFAPIKYLPSSPINANRTLSFTADFATSGQQGLVDGPFFINNKTFNMDSINIKTFLGNTEIWTLTNTSLVAHSFHIHDIQFFILDINKKTPPPELIGYKDVVLVEPNDTIRFITKFENFADNTVPFMYHCHLLHHEDEGMMGNFLVLDTMGISASIIEKNIVQNNMKVYQDFSDNELTIKINADKSSTSAIYITDMLGRKQKTVFNGAILKGDHEFKVNIGDLNRGIYLVVYTGENDQCKKIIR